MNEEITRNESCIRDVLSYNRIEVRDIQAVIGPAVSQYRVYLVPGVKCSKVKELADDLALAMGVISVRIVTLLDCMAIEVPNRVRHDVPLQSMMESMAFRESTAKLPLIIGYTIDQRVKVIDLAEEQHILVAGATKQGKTMCLKGLRACLEAKKSPSELQIVWIDPKAKNAEIPKTVETLEGLCAEMDRRLAEEVRLPYIICFVDEFADLKPSRKAMTAIIRLAQKGRHVGIHMIIATERPTVDVISGLIKVNFPTRIAFRTCSRIDSTVILDMPGAEKLIGNGDMLFSSGVELERIQCGIID